MPAFYTRDARGIPTAWVAKMRASMGRLTQRFSANRVVREYTETYYLPAAAAYRARAANQGALGIQLLEWQRHLATHWHEARFGAVRAETQGDSHRVAVELYRAASTSRPSASSYMPIRCARPLEGSANGYEYDVCVPASRATCDYTPRLIPYHPAAAVPLEAREICWPR